MPVYQSKLQILWNYFISKNKNIFLAKNCGQNETFEIRSECPKTCLFPTDSYDCGDVRPTENCYCKPGYVYDSKGRCIVKKECGCRIPNSNIVLDVIFLILTYLDFRKNLNLDRFWYF